MIAMSHALPAWTLLVWAAVSGALSMLLYARITPQKRICKLKRVAAQVQQRLHAYEGDFRGAMALSQLNVGLALRRLWLSLGPSLVAGIPVIAVMLFILPGYEQRAPSATLVFFVVAACAALAAKIAFKVA